MGVVTMVGPLCQSPNLTLRFVPATEGRAECPGCLGERAKLHGPARRPCTPPPHPTFQLMLPAGSVL